jgi:hypothetical protein
MWEGQRYQNVGQPEISGFPKAKLGDLRRVGRRKWGEKRLKRQDAKVVKGSQSE